VKALGIPIHGQQHARLILPFSGQFVGLYSDVSTLTEAISWRRAIASLLCALLPLRMGRCNSREQGSNVSCNKVPDNAYLRITRFVQSDSRQDHPRYCSPRHRPAGDPVGIISVRTYHMTSPSWQCANANSRIAQCQQHLSHIICEKQNGIKGKTAVSATLAYSLGCGDYALQEQS